MAGQKLLDVTWDVHRPLSGAYALERVVSMVIAMAFRAVEPCPAPDFPVAESLRAVAFDARVDAGEQYVSTACRRLRLCVARQAIQGPMGRVIEYGQTNVLFTNPLVKDTQDYITGRFG